MKSLLGAPGDAVPHEQQGGHRFPWVKMVLPLSHTASCLSLAVMLWSSEMIQSKNYQLLPPKGLHGGRNKWARVKWGER